MSYTTNQECLRRIGEDRLAACHDGTFDASKLRESRISAAALIDSYVSVQTVTPAYTLEDPGMAARLAEAELAIVEHLEWQRADNAEIPQRVKDRYDATMEWLRRIAAWEAVLSSTHATDTSFARKRRGELPYMCMRVFEFNLQTGASGSMKLGDSDTQVNVIAPYEGRILLVGARLIGTPAAGASVAVSPRLNGSAFTSSDGDLALTDVNVIARARLSDSSSHSFDEGDRLSLLVTEDTTPGEGLDLKAWMVVEIY